MPAVPEVVAQVHRERQPPSILDLRQTNRWANLHLSLCKQCIPATGSIPTTIGRHHCRSRGLVIVDDLTPSPTFPVVAKNTRRIIGTGPDLEQQGFGRFDQ